MVHLVLVWQVLLLGVATGARLWAEYNDVLAGSGLTHAAASSLHLADGLLLTARVTGRTLRKCSDSSYPSPPGSWTVRGGVNMEPCGQGRIGIQPPGGAASTSGCQTQPTRPPGEPAPDNFQPPNTGVAFLKFSMRANHQLFVNVTVTLIKLINTWPSCWAEYFRSYSPTSHKWSPKVCGWKRPFQDGIDYELFMEMDSYGQEIPVTAIPQPNSGLDLLYRRLFHMCSHLHFVYQVTTHILVTFITILASTVHGSTVDTNMIMAQPWTGADIYLE